MLNIETHKNWFQGEASRKENLNGFNLIFLFFKVTRISEKKNHNFGFS